MKKHLILMLLSVLTFTLSSCEEDESPILFDVESNSDPQNITVDYYSPDPSCVEKMYYITVNPQGGDLVLRCTNSDEISISPATAQYYTASVDGNLLTIHFSEYTGTETCDYSYLNVYAKVKKKSEQITISITRSPLE